MATPRQALILVGGKGSRLGALTRDMPKPMLPVQGRPFVRHLIDNLARFGIDRFVLLAGFRADIVESHFATPRLTTPAGIVEVTVRTEDRALGTGGALHRAADLLDADFLLLNGDTFFDAPLAELWREPLAADEVGRIALRSMASGDRYGRIRLDAQRRIETFQSDAGGAQAPINAGIYRLSNRILDDIPSGPEVSLERETFVALAARRQLSGRELTGSFIDIGVPDSFAAVQRLPLLRRPVTVFEGDAVLTDDASDGPRWREAALCRLSKAHVAGRYVFVVEAPRICHSAEVRERLVAQAHAHGAHVDALCPRGTSITGANAALTRLLADWPVMMDDSEWVSSTGTHTELSRHCAEHSRSSAQRGR